MNNFDFGSQSFKRYKNIWRHSWSDVNNWKKKRHILICKCNLWHNSTPQCIKNLKSSTKTTGTKLRWYSSNMMPSWDKCKKNSNSSVPSTKDNHSLATNCVKATTSKTINFDRSKNSLNPSPNKQITKFPNSGKPSSSTKKNTNSLPNNIKLTDPSLSIKDKNLQKNCITSKQLLEDKWSATLNKSNPQTNPYKNKPKDSESTTKKSPEIPLSGTNNLLIKLKTTKSISKTKKIFSNLKLTVFKKL